MVNAARNHTMLSAWRDSMLRDAPAYTAETRVMGRRLVFTADPDNVKAVLATQFPDFGKGHIFHATWRDFLGDSIFTTDGDVWHASRQLIRPQFTRDRVSDLDCFEDHIAVLFRAIDNGGPLDHPGQHVQPGAGSGRVVAMDDLFFRYTLDVITEFLLGNDIQSLW